MPQPKHDTRKRATAKDVKAAAAVGNAQFAFFRKYGTFPTNKAQLEEFSR